ncbi:anthranilate synthase component I family protein [Planctomonas deserti]|uniref:anthranilate synthase component I family protein n=1 Tax=Planctomonas deserti TaxID=2144185 RepID=UPI000D368989|nr:anthranilate synthase component I family protein [Planctomonas deserti]
MTKRLIARRLGHPVDAPAAFEALFGAAAAAFWLDSSDGSGWSYLGAGDPLPTGSGGVLDALADALESAGGPGAVDVSEAPDGMAFRLGWVGRLDYELWRRTAARHPELEGSPGGAFLAADRMLALDHGAGRAWLVAFDTADGIRWLADAEGVLAALSRHRTDAAAVATASAAAPTSAAPPAPTSAPSVATWRHSDAEYLALIERCRTAIRAGDAYQLCLTNTATVPGTFDPLAVHRRLRSISPAPHAGLLRLGESTLVSASPERFLRITPDGIATTRPIKGTRRRDADEREDSRLRRELVESDKERAENLMIVDLMRNDLSKVCRLGSVRVTALLQVESYAQVHQLVSTVEGRLAEGITAVDAVRALFPAGSMTGAPKLRAIEILAALEGGPRGTYSGAFGYLGVDGALDLAMVIRSVVLGPSGATVGAGGGITTLSEPREELEEVRLKSAPLLRALGE